MTSGTKTAWWPERTKLLIVVTLQSGLQENDKLIKLQPTSENAITAYTKTGVSFADPISVKSAITPFPSIFLSAGSAESWLVIGAGGIDSETLHES